jgi:hypothetical protein
VLVCVHVSPEGEWLHPRPVGDLVGVRVNIRRINCPDEHVVVLVLDHVWSHGNVIGFLKGGRQGTVKSHFFGKTAVSPVERGLAGLGVTATGVGPQPSGMVLVHGPSLEEETTGRIEDEY